MYRFTLLFLFLCPILLHAQESGFAYSDNFLVYGPNQEYAERMLAAAEKYRLTAANKWLGESLPEGKYPCIIRSSIKADTHAFINRANKGSKYHSITIVGPDEKKIFESPLPHEIVHAITSVFNLPRWADEGTASMEDDQMRKEKRRVLIMDLARNNSWPSIEQVMQEQVQTNDEGQFYAISNYFSEFLLTLKPEANRENIRTFLSFAAATNTQARIRGEFNLAAQKYYGMTLNELEERFHQWVKKKYKITSVKK